MIKYMLMSGKKIYIIASESVPFFKTGGLADVIFALSNELSSMKQDITIFLPMYKQKIKSKLKKLDSEFILDRNISKEKTTFYCTEDSTKNKIKTIFIKSPDINIERFYGADDGDNCRRFSLFCRSFVKYLELQEEKPDIVHCNDWQTSLVIPLMKKYKNILKVFSVHNIAYQGEFSLQNILYTDLKLKDLTIINNKINFMGTAIENADKIITVSPTYAKEILTKDFGNGLENILKKREKDVYGILNGIDTEEWNPETDEYIQPNYSIKTIDEKQKIKEKLLKKCSLENPEKPLFAIISRLATQKGIFELYDKDWGCIDKLLEKNLFNLIVIGTGELWAENRLKELDKKHKNLKAYITFNQELSHLVEAGSDFFIMPSKYEPCGLNQMYSLRYGTVPIVTNTGGLKDTVKNMENGLIIKDFSPHSISDAIFEACNIFKNKEKLLELKKCGMNQNFSWSNSAKKYLKIYQKEKIYE